MFNNIGLKIKGFAKFLFWIGVIFTILGAIVIIISGVRNSSYNSSSETLVYILGGILVIPFGIVISWLETFLLYGFGELIDSNQKILKQLERRDIK